MWWRAILSSSPSIAATASCATPKWTKPVLNQSFLGGIYCGAKVAVATCFILFFHQGVLGRGLFWQGNVMALVFTCSVQTSPWTLSDGQSILICSNHQTIPMVEAASKIDTKIYQDRYVKILYIKQDYTEQEYTDVSGWLWPIKCWSKLYPRPPKHRHEKSRVAARPRRLSP